MYDVFEGCARKYVEKGRGGKEGGRGMCRSYLYIYPQSVLVGSVVSGSGGRAHHKRLGLGGGTAAVSLQCVEKGKDEGDVNAGVLHKSTLEVEMHAGTRLEYARQTILICPLQRKRTSDVCVWATRDEPTRALERNKVSRTSLIESYAFSSWRSECTRYLWISS